MDNFYRMSGAGWCPIKQRHALHGTPEEPISPASIRRMSDGNMHEPWIIEQAQVELNAKIVEQQVELEYIDEHGNKWVGHPDGLIIDGDGFWIVDAKAVKAFGFRKWQDLVALSGIPEVVLRERSLFAYASQSALYGISREKQGGIGRFLGVKLLIRNVDTPTSYGGYEQLYLQIERDVAVRALSLGLQRHSDMSTDGVEPWECEGCKFAASCDKQVLPDGKDTPGGYELLSQWSKAQEHFEKIGRTGFETEADLKTVESELKKLKDAARDALADIHPSLRKPFHDGVRLSWSKRTKIDENALRNKFPEAYKACVTEANSLTIKKG